MGEYTCEGKVDLGEGTVSEGKVVDNHHHHHCHPSSSSSSFSSFSTILKDEFFKCDLNMATDRLDLISRGRSFHNLGAATETADSLCKFLDLP